MQTPERNDDRTDGVVPCRYLSIVVGMATLPLVGIVLTTIAGAVGLIPVEQMINVALGLGEDPGMIVFAAMLSCSPIQWFTKRTQVPVRKALVILFGGYAVANFVMFVIEEGLVASLSAPFLIAGTMAHALSVPLVATSSRWAQRKMGMKRWRTLHKLTYVIALALVLHDALVGEIGITGMLVAIALLTRIPPIASGIQRLGDRRRHRAKKADTQPRLRDRV